MAHGLGWGRSPRLQPAEPGAGLRGPGGDPPRGRSRGAWVDRRCLQPFLGTASAGSGDEVGHFTLYRSPFTLFSKDLTVSIVSASSAFLSFRHRAIRGNRTAIPLLCRVEG